MDNAFEPELGQNIFGNSSCFDISMEKNVEKVIMTIGGLLAYKFKIDNPTHNNGSIYENDTFKMRAYCWCDGDYQGHENGCPPNFEWRNFKVCWYKHACRGNSQSREMSAQECITMLIECLESIK